MAETNIILKAMKDPEFKKRLIENPRKTIEDELGTKIDNDISIKIITKKPKEMVLVIPEVNDAENIPDETLQQMAGGCFANTFGSSLFGC